MPQLNLVLLQKALNAVDFYFMQSPDLLRLYSQKLYSGHYVYTGLTNEFELDNVDLEHFPNDGYYTYKYTIAHALRTEEGIERTLSAEVWLGSLGLVTAVEIKLGDIGPFRFSTYARSVENTIHNFNRYSPVWHRVLQTYLKGTLLQYVSKSGPVLESSTFLDIVNMLAPYPTIFELEDAVLSDLLTKFIGESDFAKLTHRLFWFVGDYGYITQYINANNPFETKGLSLCHICLPNSRNSASEWFVFDPRSNTFSPFEV